MTDSFTPSTSGQAQGLRPGGRQMGGLTDDQLADLYRVHRPSMLAAARRHLGSSALAEEAVHEAFIRYRKAADKVEVAYPAAYLRMIVTNIARSMLRRQQCAQRVRAHAPRQEAVTPDEVCLVNETRHEVRLACRELSGQQRSVIEMRYWQGLSEAEIAERLNISPGSVKTHASRARSALRVSLADLPA